MKRFLHNQGRLLYRSHVRQSGFGFIVQMAIAAAIMLAFAGAGLWASRQTALDSRVAAQGVALDRIGNAYNTFIITYYNNLVNDLPITGVANIYAPKPSELQTIGVLNTSYSTANLFGGTYAATITLSPAACTPPACDVSGLVYLTTAITDPASGKPIPLGDALEVTGGPAGDGGFSLLSSAATISGYGAGWTATNPLGSVVGVLAMRVGYGSSGFAQFLRRDGTLPMTGNFNAGGNNIINADNVAASSVSVDDAAGAKVSLNNDAILQNGTNMVYETSGTHSFMNDGATTWQSVEMGALTANGVITSTSYFKAGNIATPEASCSPNGARANNTDGSGQGLTCLFGAWVPDGGRWQIYGQYAVSNGTVVPAPTCSSGGVGKILLNQESLYVDTTATVNFGPAQGSGPWTVPITDGSGNGISGYGEATVYCAY